MAHHTSALHAHPRTRSHPRSPAAQRLLDDASDDEDEGAEVYSDEEDVMMGGQPDLELLYEFFRYMCAWGWAALGGGLLGGIPSFRCVCAAPAWGWAGLGWAA